MSDNENTNEKTGTKSEVNARLKAMEDAVARVASAVSKLAEAGGSLDRAQLERLESALSTSILPQCSRGIPPDAQESIDDYVVLRRALGVPVVELRAK